MKLVTLNGPAPAEDIDRLRSKYPSLPVSYFMLLARHNGAEADLLNSWVQVWMAADAYMGTDEYQIPVYRSGYFAFGSDGGGELLVCALNGDERRPLYKLPAIGMSDADLVLVAANFEDLAAQIERARVADLT